MESFKKTESIELSISQRTVREVGKGWSSKVNIRFGSTAIDLVKVGMTSASTSQYMVFLRLLTKLLSMGVDMSAICSSWAN